MNAKTNYNALSNTSTKAQQHSVTQARLGRDSFIFCFGRRDKDLRFKRVFLCWFVSPVTGLAPAKSNRISQSMKIHKRRVYNPRTTSVYTGLPERATAQQGSPIGRITHDSGSCGLGYRFCGVVSHHAKVVRLPADPLEILSDHGLRWGMSKVSSIKNDRPGKSLVNAKKLAKGINPECLFSPCLGRC